MARCGPRGSSTSCCRPASTGRSPRSTRRCSTCCGSAPTSCCAPGSRRTPRSVRPSTWPAGCCPPGRRRSPTRCCARSRPRTSTPGSRSCGRPSRWPRSRSPRATHAGSRRRSPTRCGAISTTPARRCSPTTPAPGSTWWPAGWTATPSPRPAAAPRGRGRRTPSGWPRATPAACRRSATAAPACRTRAVSWSLWPWPPRRSTARTAPGSTSAPAPAARRRCCKPWRPAVGRACWRSNCNRTGPPWYAGPGSSSSRPPTPAARRSPMAPSTGSCSTRRAQGSGRCVADPKPDGVDNRPTCRR